MMETSESVISAAWGAHEVSLNEWFDRAAKQELVKRLWQKDPTLWKKDPALRAEIRDRLGWLDLPQRMPSETGAIVAFAEELKKAGTAHLVLLGMGGSSLAPELFSSVFGSAVGTPPLRVLDSTDPAKIREVEKNIDLAKTVFIVSSKSGGTIELVSLYKYFFQKVSAAGLKKEERFVVITDPGTPLAELAASNGFKRFNAPADVGGRFSALTVFGLLPAAAIGVDIRKILESARRMANACASEADIRRNPAAALGVAMAVLAEEGRDKLTLLTSPGLTAFGDWAEQLVAESTGKEGSGVIPVVGEPIARPEAYGDDRFFVAMSLEEELDASFEASLDALAAAGHPVLRLKLSDRHDIGGEFFRWEMATAIACSLLKVNAFDQPDVQAAKDKTKAILKQLEAGRALEVRESPVTLASFWENAEAGDYVAVLAFLPQSAALEERLAALRSQVRRKTKLATTIGIGPRYLHSTGQLHKGGPKSGVYLLLTTEHPEHLPIPGEKYGFAELELAQAMGDFEALESNGRWLAHVRLPGLSDKELDAAFAKIRQALDSETA